MPELLKYLLLEGGLISYYGHYSFWEPELIWLHIVSDLLIGLAYYSIPVMSIYFVRQRRDIPFDWVFLLFSISLIACGASHVIEVLTLWYPTYWLSGVLKAFAALISIATAIRLGEFVPKALTLPSLESRETKLQEQTAELPLINQSLEAEISELKRKEEQWQAIFNGALDAMVITDDEANYIDANPAACELFGLSKAELLSCCLPDFAVPGCNFTQAWRSFQKQGWVKGELQLLCRDGTQKDVEYAATANFFPHRHLSILRDITERKHVEEMHKRWEKERALIEDRFNFVSMMSHEFRNPLSTIKVSSEILTAFSDKITPEQKYRCLTQIESAVEEMLQLLDNILTLTRADVGELEFNPQPLDLAEFCHVLVEQMQIVDESKHSLIFTVRDSCNPACMDEHLLRHILLNLLSNAIKYSPEGGNIWLTLSGERGKAIFQIQDEGIGIPLSEQQKLFEVFHRGHNVGNIPGTGLGLCIVKKYVDLHGGEITLDSQVGEGTIFTVTLPLVSNPSVLI